MNQDGPVSAEEETRRLPPGSRGISPDLVTRNQRERLAAAAAEACAERGYAETSVADLAHRAGVSTATFYELFAGKRECALEAHRELLGRLLDEVDRACAGEGEWKGKLRAGVRTVLALLAADPPTARLLTVEVMAVGPQGAARNDVAVEAFALRLRDGGGRGAGAPGDAEWVLVAGIAALIGKHVIAGDAATLPELEDELVAMATALG
jgi:AcrR family transcriptional regulator